MPVFQLVKGRRLRPYWLFLLVNIPSIFENNTGYDPVCLQYCAIMTLPGRLMDNVHACFTVTVEPVGWGFNAPASQPLLQAAMEAQISLPSSCRNGTCRSCMCKLLKGRIGYRIEWPGLSAEEKQEGFVLPCVAYPQSDLVIEVPRALRMPADKV